MPRFRSEARGDMYVHVTVAVPKKVTKKQRELLEQLAHEMGEDVAEARTPLQKAARQVQLICFPARRSSRKARARRFAQSCIKRLRKAFSFRCASCSTVRQFNWRCFRCSSVALPLCAVLGNRIGSARICSISPLPSDKDSRVASSIFPR